MVKKMKLLFLLLLLAGNCYAAAWQKVESQIGEGWQAMPINMYRLEVPHGWLILTTFRNSVTFYPDEKHEWKI